MKIDEALHSLDRHSTTDQRLAVLGQLVKYWHGRLTGDGYTDEELGGTGLPKPLRTWYRLAGKRESSVYNQIVLQAPSELRPDADGRVIFYVENQGVYLWSITLDGDDPPVWGRFQQEQVPWSAEGMPLSEFLIGACLFQAIMEAPFGAAIGWAERTILRKITKVLPPLPLVPWRWPTNPSRLYTKNGAFMFSSPNGGEGFSIWIGSKTAKPVAFLKEIVDDRWERIEL